jgi:hypothetical protein
MSTIVQKPNLTKLLFWIEKRYNVLFTGKHGIGKTAMILEAFKKAGLRYAYFSGSTMDPFVDFVGVPLKIEGPDGPRIELVRPGHIIEADLQAIFFDEFNRTHRKIRNAVMELIQFKTINSKPIAKDLRIIWAAVNPDSDEEGVGLYDTDRLDPAQRDRFHIHVNLPYKCDHEYFAKTYGESMAKSAIQFWDELNDAERDKISPRRLDYALQLFRDNGDVRDVLPPSSNPARLAAILGTGPADEKLKQLLGDIEEAKRFLGNENNYAYALKTILSKREYVAAFVPCMPPEKIAGLYESNGNVRKAAHLDIRSNGKSSAFFKVLREIIIANQNQKLAATARDRLAKLGAPLGIEVIPMITAGVASISKEDLAELEDKAKKASNSRERKRVYDKLEKVMPSKMNEAEASAILNVFDRLCYGSKHTVGRDMPKLIAMVNHCVVNMLSNGMLPNKIEEQISKMLPRLHRYRKHMFAPYADCIAASLPTGEAKAKKEAIQERTSSEVKNPDDIKSVHDAYCKNGGTYSSYEKIEMDPKFGLKYAKGNNAYRIAKKYKEMAGVK